MPEVEGHSTERWREIEELFYAALKYSTAERAPFLSRACGSDAELLREVESLLAADVKEGFLDERVYEINAELISPFPGELQPGSLLGPYRINGWLGAGGMGEIYHATDSRLSRDVALKLLPRPTEGDNAALERFTKEARAASALNHPNIVTIFEIGEAKQGHFIAMELIKGNTLRAILQAPLSVERLISIGKQVARALAITHEAGIVHRDIKPENIMIRDDGYVKVLDFGVARLIPRATSRFSDRSFVTDPGVIIGTLPYMSPEQASGEDVTAASDIFSFGIVLYEMATGRHPFPRLRRALDSPPCADQAAAPSRINPEVPIFLDHLIFRMLDWNSNLRPGAADVEKAFLSRSATGWATSSLDRAGIEFIAPSRVGRDQERSRLHSSLLAAAEGRSSMICISGEAGIGKTTLVDDFIKEARQTCAPFVFARGRCSERLAGTEAYLPILDALQDLIRTRAGESFAHVMKLIAPNWYVQIVPGLGADRTALPTHKTQAPSQERLKLELAAFLEEVSRQGPLIIFLDDLHWADNSTVELLGYIATRFDKIKCLVVITYRPTEMLLGDHLFPRVRLELQGRGLCQEIQLGFLTLCDVQSYIGLEFPENQFPEEFLHLIYAKTEGSPLFVVEVLHYLRSRHIVVARDGSWTLQEGLPDIESDLPETVRSMIQKTIERLKGEDRLLLATASLQGIEFDSTVVAKAAALETADTEERLEALDRAHHLVRFIEESEFPDGSPTVRYRFVHSLYQNSLFASVRPTRKAALSARIAQSLLDHYGDKAQTIAGHLALLFEAARDYSRAADYFVLGSQNASRLFAYQEAVRLSRRGLELLARLPDTTDRARTELMLQTALGGPLMAIRGFTHQEVSQTYTRARELCEILGDNPQLFPALWGLWAFYYSTANIRAAFEVTQQMLRPADKDPRVDKLMLAHHITGVTLLHMGEPSSARTHFEHALEISDPKYDRDIIDSIQQSSITTVLSYNAWAVWQLGYPDRARELAKEAVLVAENLAHPPSLAATLLYSSIFHQFLGEADTVGEEAEASLALCCEYGFPLFLYNSTILKAWSDARLGRKERIADIRDCLERLRAIGTELGRPYLDSLLAECLLLKGDLTAGLQVVDEGLGLSDRTGDLLNYTELYRLKGDLLVEFAEGRGSPLHPGRPLSQPGKETVLVNAETCFLKAIELSRNQAARSLELKAVLSLARLWARRGKDRDALKILKGVYEWFTEGLGTPLLIEAKGVLESLSHGPLE